MSTEAEDKLCRSPRRRRTLHHRGLRKILLNSRRPGRARKIQHFTAKRALPTVLPPYGEVLDELRHQTYTTGTSTTFKSIATAGPSQFSNVRTIRQLSLHNDGHVNDSVQPQRLQLWDLDCLLTDCTRGICWTCTRGTSNTLPMERNWGISVVC